MHQLTPIQPPARFSKVMFWSGVLFVAAGVMIWFGIRLDLKSEFLGWFLLFCAWMCFIGVWYQLHQTPQGTLQGESPRIFKFVFGRALHGTVLETPDVLISDKMLRVGQEFTILYQQHFSRPVALTRFTIALVFHEELRQPAGEGDDVDTVERMVNTFDRVHEEIAAGPFYDKRSFTIPEDSFTISLKWSAKHTGKWLVRVQMAPADLPVFMNEYEIFVGPEGASESPRLLHDKGWWSHTRYRFADKSDQ
jgi:hypothetical protein